LRNNETCSECLDTRSVWPALRHGCYRDSRIATIPLAASIELHRRCGTWARQVDAFIVLTDFAKNLVIKAGLPGHKVFVKPNFYPGKPVMISFKNRDDRVLFVGRMSREKGVENLIKAWLLWGNTAPELNIIGDGPLRMSLEKLASLTTRIRFLGQLTVGETVESISYSKLMIVSSECFEGFPMVVREAFAFGTPAAVSNIGPLPSIVQHGISGVVFEPANPESLLREVRTAWETPGMLERLGAGARAEFEAKYTEEANYKMLMAIYEQAIEVSKSRRQKSLVH
jgi:glycosyltransferase involved in cell wall biosynthesis